MPVSLNIPVEVSAGTYETNVTVQGESVTYNYVHVPLKYATLSGDMVAAAFGELFQFKDDTEQVQVDVSGSTTAVQNLVESALTGTNLTPLATTGVVYANNSARDLTTDPLQYYVSASSHITASDVSGALLRDYVREYLYKNLSSVLGLAATTGEIQITLDQSAAIAASFVDQICGSTVVGDAIRQNLYEQLFQAAPERFSTGNNDTFQPLPFQAGDSIAFLVSYKFPASMISTPVYQNVLRMSGSSLYVGTGNKILVQTGTASPVLQNFPDFPDCTVLLRISFTE